MAQIVWALVHEEKKKGRRIYGISFPDFPGVVSGGSSMDEAIERGRATLAFHVAGLIDDGEPVPVQRSLQELRADPEFMEEARDIANVCVVEVNFDLPGKPVRVNISIDDSLLSAIDRAAEAAGKTRSGYIAEAAQARLKGAA